MNASINMLTTGLIAGGVIGVAGTAWAMSDDKTKRRIEKSGKKLMRKASIM